MSKGTKIALVVGALALAGAAGVSSLAVANYRSSHGGWGHHGGEHHGWGRHGGWHGGRHYAGYGFDRLMERFDANNDGKLTQDELNESRKALLAKHDTNKDGKLSLAEFEKLWMEVMHGRMVRGFQRIDSDGDAAITADEFLKPFSRMVERMDRNEDGVLDDQDRHHRGWRRGPQDNDDDAPRNKRDG